MFITTVTIKSIFNFSSFICVSHSFSINQLVLSLSFATSQTLLYHSLFHNFCFYLLLNAWRNYLTTIPTKGFKLQSLQIILSNLKAQKVLVNCWQRAISCFIWLSLLLLFPYLPTRRLVCHINDDRETKISPQAAIKINFFGHIAEECNSTKKIIIAKSNLFNCYEIILHLSVLFSAMASLYHTKKGYFLGEIMKMT